MLIFFKSRFISAYALCPKAVVIGGRRIAEGENLAIKQIPFVKAKRKLCSERFGIFFVGGILLVLHAGNALSRHSAALAHLLHHFAAKLIHGFSARLNVDSGQGGAAAYRRFDILHAPTAFLLAAGENAVADGLIAGFQYD